MKKQKYLKLLILFVVFFIIPSFWTQIAKAESGDSIPPTITSAGLKLKDGTFVPEGSLTNVPFNSSVIVRLQDNLELNNLTSNDYLVVKLEGVGVSGKTIILDTTNGNEKDLIFTPTEKWKKGKLYTVSMSENLKDDAGNVVLPKEFQFTVEPVTENPNLNMRNITNPHSNFSSVENICYVCHGTQKSMDLKNGKNIKDAATELCLTCHDGTVATDVVGADEKFQHGKMGVGQTVMGSSQCSDCHDPHLTSAINNPNSMKVRFAYEHKKNGVDIMIPDSDPEEAVGTQEDCYGCHKENTGKYKTLATSEMIDGETNGFYQENNLILPYNFNKSEDTSGKKDDMSLCFTCHKGSGKAVDIEQFYTVGSGHNILYDSGDLTKMGYLKCSDCHETHGSSNIYMLKKELGHENVVTYSETEKWESIITDALKERTFCLKCHNNNTKTYGVTASFDNTIKEHKDNSSIFEDGNPGIDYTKWSCSEIGCHSSGNNEKERFIKGAHSPIRLLLH